MFPGALDIPKPKLPPPPMPKAFLPVRMVTKGTKLSGPAAMGQAIAGGLAVNISKAIPEPSITITPAKKAVSARKKPVMRTPSQKLTLIHEYNACTRGDKRRFLLSRGISSSVFCYWERHIEEIRKAAESEEKAAIVKRPSPIKRSVTNTSYAERLAIVDEFLAGKSGTRLETCKKHNITLHNIDNWIRNQEFYRDVQSRGLKAVRSDITKRSSVLKKLNTIEEAAPEEAISILNDWGAIIFRDATRAQAEATRLFEKKNNIDLARKAIEENMKEQKKLQIEAIKKITEIAK
jgi:hypothetical protein